MKPVDYLKKIALCKGVKVTFEVEKGKIVNMKLFKYFTWSEIKDICNKLEKSDCAFRHPQIDFVDAIGLDNVNKLLKMRWIKNSFKFNAYWLDYPVPCFEFRKTFRKLYNFIVTPKWLWFKIYILQLYRVRILWQKLRIACGHHYDWQDYEGADLNEI